MANGKTELELAWIGKKNRPRLEPRVAFAKLFTPHSLFHGSSGILTARKERGT